MSVMSLFITYFRKVCFIAKLHIEPNLLDLLFCIFMNQEKKNKNSAIQISFLHHEI